jgi:nitronate monooxygenase
VLVAPMFALSSPNLVVASCRAGLMGSLPTSNARTSDELDCWLREVTAGLAHLDRPQWAVSMIAHSSYYRFDQELELIAEHQPNVVITALGSPRRVIETVRGYGGAVFSDVTSVEHALKAAYGGADGLVLACHSAGGPGGPRSAPAFVAEVREFFDGPVVVSDTISTGSGVHAAELLGADLACIGARFNTCPESLRDERYRAMRLEAQLAGLVATAALIGVPCGWLTEGVADGGRPTLRGGQHPRTDPSGKGQEIRRAEQEPSAAEIAEQIVLEYRSAMGAMEN